MALREGLQSGSQSQDRTVAESDVAIVTEPLDAALVAHTVRHQHQFQP